MRAWLKRSGLFLRAGRDVSALECSILLGVILAGFGGVLIAFSDDINEPIVQLGTKVAAIETPDVVIGDQVDSTR